MSSDPFGWPTEVTDEDKSQPSEIDAINLPLNRARLARFLTEFAGDRDVADLLTLDVVGTAAGLPLTSTGEAEALPSLVLRPFRLWEYVWLYQALNLSAGEIRVLDLGGPATHLTILAALAGCRVTTLDINPEFIQAAQECSRTLQIASLDARVGDMRDLSAFSEDSFDVVVSCSVLEHLSANDQEIALREMARVLKPGGLAGMTFDFGESAAGANIYLPPPHDPPPTVAEAMRRFTQGGLVPVGNYFAEDPVPGCLFHHPSIHYTVASLFLAKPPAPTPAVPQPKPTAGSVLGALRVAGLPSRLHRTASRLESSRQQAEANRIAAEERLTAIDDLKSAAEERLALIIQLDSSLQRGHRRVETALGYFNRWFRR
jgi:SAM-dependent methyltransferase